VPERLTSLTARRPRGVLVRAHDRAICFVCTGASLSIDLISTMTISSTIRSARKPPSM